MNLGKKKSIVKEYIIDAIMFLLGSFIFAISVNVFTSPNNVVPAGFTGVASIINYLFNFPIGLTIIALNIPFFIWAIFLLGYKFVAKTIIATVLSSLIIDLTEPFLPKYTGDMMLASLFGGVFLGLGVAFILIRGGTTGGTELIASLLGTYFKHISIGKLILAVDMTVVVSSFLVYKNIESPLYAIIIIFVSTKLMDSVLYGTDIGTGKVMFIISQKQEEISKYILDDLDRGVTKLKAIGGYSGKQEEVLLCAVKRQEVYKTYDMAKKIDPNVFIIVGDAGEIVGEGFKEHSVSHKRRRKNNIKNENDTPS